MNGKTLSFANDVTVSVGGSEIFRNGRQRLAGQVRVLSLSGKSRLQLAQPAQWRLGCHGTGGLQHRPVPRPPEGFATLADPGRMVAELGRAGLVDEEVEEIGAV